MLLLKAQRNKASVCINLNESISFVDKCGHFFFTGTFGLFERFSVQDYRLPQSVCNDRSLLELLSEPLNHPIVERYLVFVDGYLLICQLD